MSSIPPEVQENFKKFSEKLPENISASISALMDEKYLPVSYARLCAMNAFKRDVVPTINQADAKRFFDEAHNDLLTSHVMASIGAWRPALKSLRSFIENSCAAIYFSDHRIELIRWSQGKFRISPRELREYVSDHPCVDKISKDYNIKSKLDTEYSTLSKAVHGSNDLFRMTDSSGGTYMNKPSKAELGKWAKRESEAFDVIMVILCSYFKSELDGARRPGLRTTLHYCMGRAAKDTLRSEMGITIDK
ncbi:hypothetical protein HLM50_19330 [Sulfitobacter sp. Ks41]|uniref:hypothetical protein n=1 Tax=Sulfitobacter sp. Ks41 TaxID=2731139 RepID=UPI0023E15A06|nr:hypothetical protein [Sulfitobacter sp. Ks41]MDF3363192.1 hypothetical protein [Sulfitobacter sp. Ks41]